MKRSEINKLMREAVEFLNEMNIKLPPFAFWSPEEWAEKGHEYDEIRDNLLGWDITDFGSGDFKNTGLFLFTLRNGNLADKKYTKPYAEKLLISDVNQVTPCHFHSCAFYNLNKAPAHFYPDETQTKISIPYETAIADVSYRNMIFALA